MNYCDMIHSHLLVPLCIEFQGGCKYMVTFVEDKDTLLWGERPALEVACTSPHQSVLWKGAYANANIPSIFPYLPRRRPCQWKSGSVLYRQVIRRQQTAAHSDQSNAVALRYNQTLSAMVRPALEHALPSLWAEAYNWACYMKNWLPHSALNGITPYEAFYNAKPYISHIQPFCHKCYAHTYKEQRTPGAKLEPRSIKVRLVAYTDSDNMFRIYFRLMNKGNTVLQVKFKPSSYTSVDIHTRPLPCDFADNPPTIISELRPETPPPNTETTTASTLQTLPGSYLETGLQSRHPPLIEVASPATNVQLYIIVYHDKLESGRDSVFPNPIAGPSTPPRNTSTCRSSATKSH